MREGSYEESVYGWSIWAMRNPNQESTQRVQWKGQEEERRDTGDREVMRGIEYLLLRPARHQCIRLDISEKENAFSTRWTPWTDEEEFSK
jgi:hypothetical protein